MIYELPLIKNNAISLIKSVDPFSPIHDQFHFAWPIIFYAAMLNLEWKSYEADLLRVQ